MDIFRRRGRGLYSIAFRGVFADTTSAISGWKKHIKSEFPPPQNNKKQEEEEKVYIRTLYK